MYEISTRSNKAEKQFFQVIYSRKGIIDKLDKLRQNPRKEIGAHKLKGKLEGMCSCVLGSNIRMIYEIDDDNKEIIVFAVGSHKIYL